VQSDTGGSARDVQEDSQDWKAMLSEDQSHKYKHAHSKTDVNEKITAAACDKGSSSRGEDNCDLVSVISHAQKRVAKTNKDENNVGASDWHFESKI